MEFEFTVQGRRYRATRERVIEALHAVPPEPPTRHMVEIEGVRYPVNQALSVSFGIERADFITNTARRVFRRLGFQLLPSRETDSTDRKGAPLHRTHPAGPVDTRGRGEIQRIDIPFEVLRWSHWERWDEIAGGAEHGSEIHIPTGKSGVYEVRIKSQTERLTIGKAADLRGRIRQALVRGNTVHPAGDKIRRHEDTADLVVRWAVTTRPAAVEEELHQQHIRKFGHLPKYTRHT